MEPLIFVHLIIGVALLTMLYKQPHMKYPYYLTKDIGTYAKGTFCRIHKEGKTRQLIFPDKSTYSKGTPDTHYPIKLRFIYRLLNII